MYIQPQLQVFQEFRSLPQNVVANLNAFVLGPNYVLMRYSETDEKALIGVGAYNPSAQESKAYPNRPSGAVIDADYVQLYFENVRARYATLNSSNLVVVSETERNKLYAAPSIAEPEAVSDGVVFELGGMFRGGPQVPETFVVVPSQSTGAVWSRFGTDNVVLDVRGRDSGSHTEMLVPASSDPLQAGVVIDGPYGIMFDFDRATGIRKAAALGFTGQPLDGDEIVVNGTTITISTADIGASSELTYDNIKTKIEAEDIAGVYDIVRGTGTMVIIGSNALVVTASVTNATLLAAADYPAVSCPRTVSLGAQNGAAFRIGVKNSALPAVAVAAIGGDMLTLAFVAGTPASAVLAGMTLTLTYDEYTTLEDLHAAIAADSDIVEIFKVSGIAGGDGDSVITSRRDEAGIVIGSSAVVMARDIYAFDVSENSVIFASGNGFTNSSEFKSRGVKVGDYIQYSALTSGGVVSGESRVAALEADSLAASVGEAEVGANAGTEIGDSLPAKVASGITMAAGDDNQRIFDGALTSVFAADPELHYSPGRYSEGVLAESYSVVITASGVPGVARCTVSNASGSYVRQQVVIVPWINDTAALYLGNNLWCQMDPGIGESLEFFTGDTYGFSQAVIAPWYQVENIDALGSYNGSRDTVYAITVTRGGVFNRSLRVIDGLVTASRVEIDASGAASGTIAIYGENFVVADWTTFVAAVNASTVQAYAVLESDVVTITGPVAVLETITDTGSRDTAALAKIEAQINFAQWQGGDVDDEYVLRCTQGGVLGSARFALESQRGDNQTGIRLSATVRDVGVYGLSVSVDVTGAPVFSIGDTWHVIVKAARPMVQITDSEGIDSGASVVVNNDVELVVGTRGIRAVFGINTNTASGFASEGGLLRGDVYYISATAEAQGAYRTLVLRDEIPDVATGYDNFEPEVVSAELMLTQNSAMIDNRNLRVPGSYNWIAGEESVVINAAIYVQDPSWTELGGALAWIPVKSADALIQYRALSLGFANGIYTMDSIGDVVSELGKVHPDNPLAQGVYNALLNSGDRVVYFSATGSDDLSGYQNVLALSESTNKVYAFAPMTRDRQILDSVAAHINAMSTETNKKWRLAFVGTKADSTREIYSETLGNALQATVAANIDGKFTRLNASGATFVADVRPGDVVKLGFSTDPWGSVAYTSVAVATVLTDTTLILATDLGAAIPVAEKVEIIRVFSVAEQAEAIATAVAYFNSRRVYSAFPESARSAGVVQTSEFMAAAVAGLMSSVPPQQGLTQISVLGFDDLSDVYSKYTVTQLNLIAGNGGMILMQDGKDGTVYVRHQVSTKAADGNILTTELSVTKNLDAISYYFTNVLSGYIGRYNITPELLLVIETQLIDGLHYMASDLTGAGLLGPMIVGGDNTLVRSVQQHPTLKDHISAIVDIELPLPVNVIQLRLVV